MVQPTGLQLINRTTLRIDWSDGKTLLYDLAELRRHCPCATCADERQRAETHPEPEPDDPERPQREMTLLDMRPVGQYAYTIHFSDGHSTGIFTLDFLREFGREA